jgi:hypothetical protein
MHRCAPPMPCSNPMLYFAIAGKRTVGALSGNSTTAARQVAQPAGTVQFLLGANPTCHTTIH